MLIRRRAPEGNISVNVVEFGDEGVSVGLGSMVDMAVVVGASEYEGHCPVFCSLESVVVSLTEFKVEISFVPAVQHDEIATARAISRNP